MEPEMPLPIEKIIADLSNLDKPVLNSKLVDLSDLNSEELGLLEKAWTTIELKRRRRIMNRLVELAEDNPELNFDVIFKSRLKDEDAGVRSKAMEGLWENEESSMIDPLIKLLNEDSSAQVQEAAALALGKFTMLAAFGKLRSYHADKIAKNLFAVLEDKGKPIEIRRRALEAVAPLDLVPVKEVIIEAYQSDNPRLKTSAVYAMGKNCNLSWLPILLDELNSVDSEMRYEAASACGELGEEEAVPHLIKLIGDSDIEVQLAAIQALGKIGGSKAKNCLKVCLNNPSKAIRQAAQQALNQLKIEEDPLSFKIWDANGE